jgi:membrane protein DedA with SNARE-associated domain
MGEPLLIAHAIAIPTGVAVLAYLVVGLVIGVESMGVPLPGETTLIAAALLASQDHQLKIELVILAAATGAIIGDSAGYYVGRKAGRRLFDRLGRRFRHFSEDRIVRAEKYFHKYGVWTVFFGRFVALLRIFAGPMAGMLRMHYPRFLVANAAGGIAWASTIGVVAYQIGDNADQLFGRLSIGAAIALAVVAVALYVVHRIRKHRREQAVPGEAPEAGALESADV